MANHSLLLLLHSGIRKNSLFFFTMQHVSEDNLPLKSLWKSQKAKRPTFLYGVNGRRRLVPDDDIMYTIKSSGDGDTLPLSSGQVHTVELP
jgi:hypothetical protein